MRENKYLINTIQEITIQAYDFGIYGYFFNERNMSRTDIFQLFVKWAEEFEESHKDFDWLQGSFYDEVDDFIGIKSHKARGKRVSTFAVERFHWLQPLKPDPPEVAADDNRQDAGADPASGAVTDRQGFAEGTQTQLF